VNHEISHFDPIRIASYLFMVTGILGMILFSLAVIVFVLGREPSPDLGFIQATGGTLYLASVSLFAALSSLEIAVGRWLRRGQKKGAIIGMMIMVPSYVLSIGMVLPIWLVVHPIKLLLLLTGWKQLR
jgi:hypothetical protein